MLRFLSSLFLISSLFPVAWADREENPQELEVQEQISRYNGNLNQDEENPSQTVGVAKLPPRSPFQPGLSASERYLIQQRVANLLKGEGRLPAADSASEK